MAKSEKGHKPRPGGLPDQVTAPLTDQGKRHLAEIQKRLPGWSRRAILRAALTLGLRQVDERPADALLEFGR